jgi:hypothetical protein
MKKRSITDYIMGGIFLGVGVFFIWVFYPREEQKDIKPDKVVEIKKKEEYQTIQSITDIDGTWSYGNDTIFFDSKKMIVQWNRELLGGGPEMKMDYIDSTDRPDYPHQEFYVYGTIGTTKIFRTRVLINDSRNSIYLDRVDGGTPHYYNKVD